MAEPKLPIPKKPQSIKSQRLVAVLVSSGGCRRWSVVNSSSAAVVVALESNDTGPAVLHCAATLLPEAATFAICTVDTTDRPVLGSSIHNVSFRNCCDLYRLPDLCARLRLGSVLLHEKAATTLVPCSDGRRGRGEVLGASAENLNRTPLLFVGRSCG